MTIRQSTNLHTTEHSPEGRVDGELSPEAIAAQGELHRAWNDTLYGPAENSQVNDGAIAVEDLGQRIDQQQVSYGVDGGRHLDASERQVEFNENGLTIDARIVQGEANSELAEVGMANRAENTVTQRGAANETVAEVLIEGQDDSGRLSREARRDARNAAIATELDRSIRRGETEALQYLPPSVAAKVATWLGNIGERYGGAEFAPNAEVAAVGEYVSFAEKVSDVTDGETVVYTDSSTGDVRVDAMNDVVMRVLDGDPEVAGFLSPDQHREIRDMQDNLQSQGERFFSERLATKDQDALIDELHKALLVASAERLAAATV